MKIEMVKATQQQKSVLCNLMELYQYDLSEIEAKDVDACGLFGYRYLDYYWTEPERHPFMIKVDEKLAGFVLVNQHTYLYQDSNAMSIAEFFILKKYRNQGIGKQVATYIFNQFPGTWEVRQTALNLSAQAFWGKVISQYTNGAFNEFFVNDRRWHGPIKTFNNSDKLLT
ncbi:GNAT family N-acetyltransferase [Nostoc sp. 'Peltigera malacea cyanobiont' DB3992]|uniref:GNAT family N-acetyltransferase n=1 Tax=Nostoc sp. 'Peltigera malacea cyanobiont' DB3992 TaxID=1206980 RepID=UPI000C03A82D|nr:GNAT family N-acetyltransferase [Nostoc sp. 'Peltigera malacea cyanobiont' DB3992]PHM10769.1 GNAT family N-acetyltransferase [Nostoc sp. 'Peltigera malacea cyanobiont' DB3992]